MSIDLKNYKGKVLNHWMVKGFEQICTIELFSSDKQ